MDLKDILSKKKAETKSNLEIEEKEEKEEDISYLTTGKYLPNYIKNEIFIATFTPLIRYPYSLFRDHFFFSTWLLGDNIHVLNTFNPIDPDYLFSFYSQYNPPQCCADLHRLYVAISRICLVMPPIYLEDIEEIIKNSKKFDKNPKIRQTMPYLNGLLS